MDESRARNSLFTNYQYIYVKDNFLLPYEENNIYFVNPERGYVAYNSKWYLGHTFRINRDIIRVEVKKLYESCPDYIIFDLYKHAIPPIQIKPQEKNIAKRTKELKQALQDLNKNLQKLSSQHIYFINQNIIDCNIWDNSKFLRLAQHVPIEMTQQRFLERCKILNEILIFNAKNLKKVLNNTELPRDEYKEFRDFKLLQVLSNTLDLTHVEVGDADIWKSIDNISAISNQNKDLKTLFTINDFRNIDGHLGNTEEIYGKLNSVVTM